MLRSIIQTRPPEVATRAHRVRQRGIMPRMFRICFIIFCIS